MKKIRVSVRWNHGLHTRPAIRLVQLANRYRSAIYLKAYDRIADARSIISVLLLCATFGTTLEVEVFGDDEDLATAAIVRLFETDEIHDALLEEPTTESGDESTQITS